MIQNSHSITKSMCWLRHWYTIEILDLPSGLVRAHPLSSSKMKTLTALLDRIGLQYFYKSPKLQLTIQCGPDRTKSNFQETIPRPSINSLYRPVNLISFRGLCLSPCLFQNRECSELSRIEVWILPFKFVSL